MGILKSILPYTMLWWHFSKSDISTPDLLINLGFDVKMRSIQDKESLVTCVGWLISWLYPAARVMMFISRPSILSLSNFHHFVDLALKSPVIIEQTRLRSLIFDKNKSKSVQKLSNSSRPWLGDLYKHEKKHFSPPILISKNKHSFKLLEDVPYNKWILSSFFLLGFFVERKRLYPSIVIHSSDESTDRSKNVSNRQIKSKLFDTDTACDKKTLLKLWAAKPFNFQGQKKNLMLLFRSWIWFEITATVLDLFTIKCLNVKIKIENNFRE